jgi:arylsulfatase A-like enzyme
MIRSIAGACLLGLIALWSAPASFAQDRPNIVMIVTEGFSMPRLHSFGDPVAITPTFDALAAHGVRYRNSYTTSPVCSPSRATLLTGVYPISIGTQHMRSYIGGYAPVPPPDVKGFPEILRAHGYFTFITQGEDYQFGGSSVLSGGPFSIWDHEGGDDRTGWRKRSPGQPFFGWINLGCTHESGTFTPLGHWPHSRMHLLMQVAHAIQGCIGEGPIKPADVTVPPYYPDTPAVRSDIAKHYNNIHTVDGQIAEIIQALKDDGLLDKTIVLVLPDHGDGLPRAKRDLYDAGIHLPLIVRWPEKYRPAGVTPGSVDDRMVSYVDIAPTLLSMAGIAVPSFVQGQDFRTSNRQYIFAAKDRFDEVMTRQRAVRDARFKYIRNWFPNQPDGYHLAYRDIQESMREMWQLLAEGKLNAVQKQWFEPVGKEQLFDTANDPYELHNLADDPAYGDDLQRLRSAMDAWLAKAGDMSDIPEPEMALRFWPGGKQPDTVAPTVTIANGRVTVTDAEAGASIGYRINGGPWRLYTMPVPVRQGDKVEAKAIRYGCRESETVSARL